MTLSSKGNMRLTKIALIGRAIIRPRLIINSREDPTCKWQKNAHAGEESRDVIRGHHVCAY